MQACVGSVLSTTRRLNMIWALLVEMKERPLSNRDEILRLMREGWELGWASRTRGPSAYWLQRPGLMRGGDIRKVHRATANAMWFKKLIVDVPAKDTDPFWLRRYAINETIA